MRELVFAAACVSVSFLAPRARADAYDDALTLHARHERAATPREREIAQFDLAVKLHAMGLRNVSYGIYARAQIQSGMAHVLMRRTNDALRSFQRVAR